MLSKLQRHAAKKAKLDKLAQERGKQKRKGRKERAIQEIANQERHIARLKSRIEAANNQIEQAEQKIRGLKTDLSNLAKKDAAAA
jgi:chromosome segregation ATPase